jgi:hypothetical protein
MVGIKSICPPVVLMVFSTPLPGTLIINGIFEGSRAWKIGTNEQVDASLYQKEYDKAKLLKETSKEILEQNLIANFVTH